MFQVLFHKKLRKISSHEKEYQNVNGPSESFSIICAILASSVRISISCLQKLVRSRCTLLRQEPLDIWTEHSNCHIHRMGT